MFNEENLHKQIPICTPDSQNGIKKLIFMFYRFSVCGDIFITHFPEGIKSMSKYKVTMTPQDKERTSVLITDSDTQGRFCFQARRGSYNIQVMAICRCI